MAIAAVSGASVLTLSESSQSAPEKPALVPEISAADVEAGKDAVAALQIAGAIISQTGGQTVYSGEGYDNYGESEVAPAGRPSLSVVRNAAQSTVSITASNPDGYTFTMQARVDADDTFMSQPLGADALATGPDPANVTTMSASFRYRNEAAETIILSRQDDQLVDSQGGPLDVAGVRALDELVLARLQESAAASGIAQPALPPDAINELRY